MPLNPNKNMGQGLFLGHNGNHGNISRKRRSYVPIRATDSTGWRQDGDMNSDRIMVFRSPCDSNIWVTKDERDALINEIRQQHDVGTPFKRRKGFRILCEFQQNVVAWFAVQKGSWRRVQRELVDGSWVPYRRIRFGEASGEHFNGASD